MLHVIHYVWIQYDVEHCNYIRCTRNLEQCAPETYRLTVRRKWFVWQLQNAGRLSPKMIQDSNKTGRDLPKSLVRRLCCMLYMQNTRTRTLYPRTRVSRITVRTVRTVRIIRT